jgi:hypothetical protein
MPDKNFSSNSTHLQKLAQHPSWQKLSKIWKKMNFFEHHKEKITVLQKNFEVQRNLFNSFNNLLDDLFADQMLSKVEVEFLNRVISHRLEHLKFTYGMVTCYMALMSLNNRINTSEQLEKRFADLEILYQNNKINKETYLIKKNEIKKALEELQKTAATSSTDKGNVHTPINEELLDLLLHLNK